MLNPSDRPCHSSWTDRVNSSVLQLSFIQKIKENASLSHEGMLNQMTQRRERQKKRERERERESSRACVGEHRSFGSSYYMFVCLFVSPPGPALCKLGQSEVLFVPPEILTQVFGPSFFFFFFFFTFSQAFPFLVFQPPPFWTPFPILTT